MQARLNPALALALLVTSALAAGCASPRENEGAVSATPPATAASETETTPLVRVEVWMAKKDEGETRVNLTLLDNATARPYGSLFFNLTSNETLQKRAEFWIDKAAWMDLVLNRTGDIRGGQYRMDVPKTLQGTNPSLWVENRDSFFRVWVFVEGDGVNNWGMGVCPLPSPLERPEQDWCAEQPFSP